MGERWLIFHAGDREAHFAASQIAAVTPVYRPQGKARTNLWLVGADSEFGVDETIDKVMQAVKGVVPE